MAGRAIAVGQMPELPVNDPAVIDDNVTALGEALDGQQRAGAEAMFAVPGLTASRDANAVADGQGQWHRPIDLESLGQLSRRTIPLAHDQARSFRVATRRILVELEQEPRLILGSVRFLRVGQ